MKTIAKGLLRLLFGCPHERLTWVFWDERSEGFYQRCTECGKRFEYVGVEFAPIPRRRA